MKKIVSLLLSLSLFLLLTSCTKPLGVHDVGNGDLTSGDDHTSSVPEITNDDTLQGSEVSGTEPADDILAVLISTINSESIFYAQGGPALHIPKDLLTYPVGGPRHYGKSVLSGNFLLYEYLSGQQTEICEKLQSVDTSTLELVDKSVLQEKAGIGTFHTWIENPNGSKYRFSLYLCKQGDISTEVIIYAADYQSNHSAYYLGEYDDAVFGGFIDMLQLCRISTEATDTTAYITFADNASKKVLLRYQNAEFVNIVDGVTLEDPLQEDGKQDYDHYDVKAVIGTDEYLIDLETGIIMHKSSSYQLAENKLLILANLLSQAH